MFCIICQSETRLQLSTSKHTCSIFKQRFILRTKYWTEVYDRVTSFDYVESFNLVCIVKRIKKHTYRRKSTSAQVLRPVFRHEGRERLSFFRHTSDQPLDPKKGYANPGNWYDFGCIPKSPRLSLNNGITSRRDGVSLVVFFCFFALGRFGYPSGMIILQPFLQETTEKRLM